MSGEGSGVVQVSLGDFAVEVKLTDEGIVVDVFDASTDAGDLLASTWAMRPGGPWTESLSIDLSPKAIREHYECADDETVDGLTDEDLREVALIALGQDALWQGYGEALDQAVIATRRNRRVAADSDL